MMPTIVKASASAMPSSAWLRDAAADSVVSEKALPCRRLRTTPLSPPTATDATTAEAARRASRDSVAPRASHRGRWAGRAQHQVVEVALQHRGRLDIMAQLRPGAGVCQVGEEDADLRIRFPQVGRILQGGPDGELGRLLSLYLRARQIAQPGDRQVGMGAVGKCREAQETAHRGRVLSG